MSQLKKGDSLFCFCRNQRLQPEKEDDGSIRATSAAEKGGREELRTERKRII